MYSIIAKIGPFTIYSYGMMIAIAFLFGIFIAKREAVRKNIKPEFRDREVLVTKRKADTKKAKKLLGFEAKVKVEDGLAKVAQEIASNPERY